MVVEARAEAGAQVASEADFYRNLALRELLNQIRIVECSEAVPNAFGAQVKRSPN